MLNKILKITATITFIVALAVNTTVSYNDPFEMMSLNAIATGTDTTITGGETGLTGETGYIEVSGVEDNEDEPGKQLMKGVCFCDGVANCRRKNDNDHPCDERKPCKWFSCVKRISETSGVVLTIMGILNT